MEKDSHDGLSATITVDEAKRFVRATIEPRGNMNMAATRKAMRVNNFAEAGRVHAPDRA